MRHVRPRLEVWITPLLMGLVLGCSRVAAQGGAAVGESAYPLPPETEAALTPPPTPSQEQPEVLSRGPVHEAFAEPVSLNLQESLTAPRQPPPPIEEVPPTERPQGQQFVWIPGYWAWDADRNGYIWVSACWRAAPPRMSWIPGYWSQVPGGWQWIAGFWASTGVQQLEYLPPPPTLDDWDPPAPQPAPDMIWVPPCMYWIQGQYVRRNGYWLTAQSSWIWIPSHYVYTPRGYIFAAGHWDYALERRGLLFAPVFFPTAVYVRPAFTFSPSIVIDLGLLRLSLFAYPRYCHYFFGDYYDDVYLSVGIYPRFDSHRVRTWHDPVYEHDRWRNHRDRDRWERHERDEYTRRRDDRNLRPSRTFREQESRLAELPEPQRRALRVTQPISVAAAREDVQMRFEKLSSDAREKVTKQATTARTYRDERHRWESVAEGDRAPQPIRGRVPAVVTPPVNLERAEPRPRKEREDPAPQPAPQPAPRTAPAVVMPPVNLERAEPRPRSERETTPPAPQPAPRTAPTVVMPPVNLERAEPRPRSEREAPAAKPTPSIGTPAPTPRQDPVAFPARQPRTAQAERVTIPPSPMVGKSGVSDIFRRSPPARPTGELKEGKEGGTATVMP